MIKFILNLFNKKPQFKEIKIRYNDYSIPLFSDRGIETNNFRYRPITQYTQPDSYINERRLRK